jgi:hypothetical protein
MRKQAYRCCAFFMALRNPMAVKTNNENGLNQDGASFIIPKKRIPYKTMKNNAIPKRIFDAIFKD